MDIGSPETPAILRRTSKEFRSGKLLPATSAWKLCAPTEDVCFGVQFARTRPGVSSYLAERPPSGPDWQQIKWDGDRLIARKDGDRVRLWARTGTDYTTCLDRIRIAVAALPVASAVLDGEAVAFDAEGRPDFAALKGREGQANAVMIAYDLLEIDGQDVGASLYRNGRKRMARLLSKPK